MSENNFESTLSSILSNENMMSKIAEIAKQSKSSDMSDAIPQVMSLLSSDFGKTDTPSDENADLSKESENSKTVFKEKTDPQKESHKKALDSFGSSISKNSKLLQALKPYLSRERAEMIDNILKISQIADIMKLAK